MNNYKILTTLLLVSVYSISNINAMNSSFAQQSNNISETDIITNHVNHEIKTLQNYCFLLKNRTIQNNCKQTLMHNVVKELLNNMEKFYYNPRNPELNQYIRYQIQWLLAGIQKRQASNNLAPLGQLWDEVPAILESIDKTFADLIQFVEYNDYIPIDISACNI